MVKNTQRWNVYPTIINEIHTKVLSCCLLRAKKLESLTSHAGEDVGRQEASCIIGEDVDWLWPL